MKLPRDLCFRFLITFQLLAWAAAAPAGAQPTIAHPASVRDDVFLQEVGNQIKTANPLTAVAVLDSEVYIGSKSGVSKLKNDSLVESGLRSPIRRLCVAGGKLWAVTTPGLYRLDGEVWTQLSGEAIGDVCQHLGEVVASTDHRLWRVRGDRLEPLANLDAPFAIARVLSRNESLYIQGGGRLTVFESGRFGGFDMWGGHADESWDWGSLPSPNARDALSFKGRLILATDRGLGILRGMSVMSVRGEDGLPWEDAVCLAAGFTNDFWIGTTRGAIRSVGNEFQYLAGRRWLPSDSVNAIAAGVDSVYIATGEGLGIIRYEPYTLLKKAAYYERHMDEWGQRRLGLVHKLEWDEKLKEFVREAGDNDGGYTGDYLAAQAFRFGATHDPAARREATNSFWALRWLEVMTGIPGFPARSVWVKGEKGHKSSQGSGGLPAEWHDTADGRFEWKGDTSSDELCSHFHAVALFLELAAQGREVEQAKNHLARIASHLIDHQWQLIDLDGKPTRWGRWDPDYFNTDEGRYDRGLQSLELLSFIKTAEAVTGDPKFTSAYRKLVEMGYPENTLRQRQVFPPESILHFEDQLALWSYWNLLRYEKDPNLRSLYRRSFERTYEVIRVEQEPWFNYVHGALTGENDEALASIAHLREWPLDLRTWSYQNSHRADLRTPSGYRSLKGGIKAFSPREREPIRWDAWTMQADGGSGGNDVVEPSGWLMAYWMGRYYGFIEPPSTQDPKLLAIDAAPSVGLGAKPYDGPPRPEIQ